MSSAHSAGVPQRLTSGDDPVAIRMYARSLEAALDVATLESHGSEFDSRWSCGKTWSAELDQEYVPENLAQPLPTASDPIYMLPDQDENPYAPPIAGTVVVAASGDDVEAEIRRAFRAMVLSMFFPPLALYTFFLGTQTLSRISRNELSASTKQCWRLRWIMIATVIIAPALLLGFGLIL
jgi:hypothetical protein